MPTGNDHSGSEPCSSATDEEHHSRKDHKSHPPTASTGDMLELTVTSVAYGGKGVARQGPGDSHTVMADPLEDTTSTADHAAEHSPGSSQERPGKVWFVEGAITGDRVRARVTADQGRYGEAQLMELLTPSPLRQPPLCPFEKSCGGCQWMGIAYEQQLAWKKGFVETALRRIGKLKTEAAVDIIPSPHVYGYRNRILVRSHWTPPQGSTPGRLDMGYFARGSRQLVPISRCEIAAESINSLLAEIKSWTFADAPAFKARLEIQEIPRSQTVPFALPSTEKALVVTVYPAEGPREPMANLADRLRSHPHVLWAGLVFDLSSAPLVEFDRDLDRDFFTIPGQFQQINMDLNRTLRRLVQEKVELERPTRILDVFCGSGNLSLPLAGPSRYVEGVEFNKKAIVCAHRNVEKNQLQNIVFLAGDAEKHLWKVARGGESFDMVILDPPRQGMYKGMVPLKMLAPKHILYVSCDPTTLARDLGYLLRKDAYIIESVTALDFFPNTYHVETVVFLRKNTQ